MFLILEIQNPEAARFGAQRSHVFGIQGGTIGRAAGNEWVIPDQHIHGIHAAVRFMSGLFFIEKRGQNLVAVNKPDIDLQLNEAFPLKEGDRLFIDEYEIAVRLSAKRPDAAVVAPAIQVAEPFDPMTGPRDRGALLPPSLLEQDLGDLDPLGRLGSPVRRAPEYGNAPGYGSTAGPQESAPLGGILSHGSVMNDHFRAPELHGIPEAPPGGNFIPDNWDRTSFTPSAKPPAAAPARMAPSVPPVMAPPVAPRPQYAPPVQAPAPPTYGAGVTLQPAAGPGLEAVAAALGLRVQELQPGDADALGRSIYASLAGCIELLQVRNEIRTRFRVSTTQRVASDPNPIKRAPNVEDAVHELFRRRQPGVLPLDQAMADAMDEARFHQLAMLDAMRHAFDKLLERLDPERQVDPAETGIRLGGVNLGGRGRQWESFVQYFREQVGNDREDAFRRLFGAEFAPAYEQALERIRRMVRHSRTRKTGE
jgi:type VI secretion system protein ImpI